MNTLEIIDAQRTLYPDCTAQDLYKALYQAHMGCGHLVTDTQRVKEYLQAECDAPAASFPFPLTETLGEYARVHLTPYLREGGSIKTLLALFLLSAKAETDEARQAFAASIRELAAHCPQDAPFFEQMLSAGLLAVHHSAAFRAAYSPAYRVICSEYADLMPLFLTIDHLMCAHPHLLISIDGRCGSGKTTLANLLARVYDDAEVFRMDDFFLRPEQRTLERYAAPGENVDHERFLEEVLLPLSHGEAPLYRPFNCKTLSLLPAVSKRCAPLNIIEGSYSLHAELAQQVHLRFLLDMQPEDQLRMLANRESPESLERFRTRWIPLENLYFNSTDISSRCDLLVFAHPQEKGPHRFTVTFHDP